MSNSISYVAKTTFNALFNGEKVAINNQAFLVNANSFGTLSHDDKIRERAEKRVENKKEKVSEYIADVKFIIGTGDKEHREFSPVYKNDINLIEMLNGVFDEYEESELERAGTLLKVDGKWVIESDLEVVEQIRRNREFKSMDKGNQSIGGITSSEKYKEYLAKVDAELGSMRTRGHGIH
jgi:hypothetical protein